MASPVHYLTVQDILWINLQATKKVHRFDFAKLEEATYYQYSYGASNSILPQAARFVSGFLKLHPLAEGNEVTSFVGLLAFLRVNGFDINLDDSDALRWFNDLAMKRKSVGESIQSIAVHSHGEHHGMPSVRSEIQAILKQFPATVEALSAVPVAA